MNPLSCASDDAWEHGNSLINYMKMVEMDGLTGRVKFDSEGQRSDFQLEIVELKKPGLEKVGVWSDITGVNFNRNFTETYSEIVESLQNKTLVVTTIMVRRDTNSNSALIFIQENSFRGKSFSFSFLLFFLSLSQVHYLELLGRDDKKW